MMRGHAIIAFLAFGACTPAAGPASFDIATLKPADDPVTLTGWYQAATSYRAFRLYPTAGDHTAMGKGQCVSGIASSLAGIPADTLNGKKVTISGNLFATGSPDIGDTPNDCGASVMLLANDIVYAE